jgi:hypothetical protein
MKGQNPSLFFIAIQHSMRAATRQGKLMLATLAMPDAAMNVTR